MSVDTNIMSMTEMPLDKEKIFTLRSGKASAENESVMGFVEIVLLIGTNCFKGRN